MNISIAVADSDREYARRLSEALEQYRELAIHVYTTREGLIKAMETSRFDVVLFDPDLSEEKLSFPNTRLPICLYSDEARNAGLYTDTAKTEKYQRISGIYRQVIREYADKAGYLADFDRSQNTEILAVYSPCGGSGKTTIALALASQFVKMGKNALFISLEQLNSSFLVNPKKEEGLISLMEAASDPQVNFELKLKGLLKTGFNGMLYLEGFERLADHDAVTSEEIGDMLKKIVRCGICDVVVVDMESCLSGIGRAAAKLADRLLIVERPGELAGEKLELFSRQAFANEHKEKMAVVRNFAESSSRYGKEPLAPVVGTVHHYGSLPLDNIVRAIEANHEIAVEQLVRMG